MGAAHRASTCEGSESQSKVFKGITRLVGWGIRRGSKSSNNFDKFGQFGLREEAMVGWSRKDCKSFCFWHRVDSGNCKFKKVAHGGEASQFGPGRLLLAKEDTRTAKVF